MSDAMPTPSPALRRLDRLVGTWEMRGSLVGSDEEDIIGEAMFRWIPGGFFLEQRFHMDFAGLEIHSVELIGHDPDTDSFPSTVYSSLSPAPLPYRWRVDGEDVTIDVTYGPMDSTFHGTIGDDGDTFTGGWRPNAGADEKINVAYDIRGRRTSA